MTQSGKPRPRAPKPLVRTRRSSDCRRCSEPLVLRPAPVSTRVFLDREAVQPLRPPRCAPPEAESFTGSRPRDVLTNSVTLKTETAGGRPQSL